MKKKVKKRIKKIFRLLIIIILIGILILFMINKNKHSNLYSKEANEIINKNKYSEIYKYDYSKTIDELLKNNLYNNLYLNEYLDIEYINNKDFINNINKYLEIGYTGKEINNIYKLSDTNKQKLLIIKKQDFDKFINIKNFNIDNIERYNNYSLNNNYELKDIVTYVNINLDKEYYTDTLEVNDPNDVLVLVNKYNYLPKNYKPSDLVYVPGAYGNNVPFRSVLKDDFIKLQEAAKKEININLMPTTAFRDESFQTTLYNNYVAKDGKKEADTYSARPGYSEHQTGLAIDLKNTALNNTRLTDDNYKWLSNNAYKYGFIIRYPKEKEYITGYQFENWHIRYVGKDNAKIIYEYNLTLEEYIDLYIKEY